MQCSRSFWLAVLTATMIQFWVFVFVTDAESATAQKPVIELTSVRPGLLGKSVVVTAKADFYLPEELKKALHQGVDLVFDTNFLAFKTTFLLINESVLDLQMYRRITYHALTQRYSVEDETNQTKKRFNTLESALDYLGTYNNYPIVSLATFLDSQATHMKMQIKLVQGNLPVTLLLKSYLSTSWRLSSDWYQWKLPNIL